MVENGVLYGDFLLLNSMFGQIFIPAIFWCKCVKRAILSQTFPLKFPFVIGTPFVLAKQRKSSNDSAKMGIRNMAFSTYPFQTLHFQTYLPIIKIWDQKIGLRESAPVVGAGSGSCLATFSDHHAGCPEIGVRQPLHKVRNK